MCALASAQIQDDLSDYERVRQERISRNNHVLQTLGLTQTVHGITSKPADNGTNKALLKRQLTQTQPRRQSKRLQGIACPEMLTQDTCRSAAGMRTLRKGSGLHVWTALSSVQQQALSTGSVQVEGYARVCRLRQPNFLSVPAATKSSCSTAKEHQPVKRLNMRLCAHMIWCAVWV